MKNNTNNPIDTHIAAKLRALRMERRMSQSELGAAGDVSFQQIQKYEKGKNRVSASMLFQLAKALDAPLLDFFPDDRAATSPKAKREP